MLRWLNSKVTPWSRILLGKLIVAQLLKKFPAFLGTWRVSIVFKRARRWSLLGARYIDYTFSVAKRFQKKFRPIPIPWSFRNNLLLLRWGVVSYRPTTKLEDHSFSAFRDYLFNIRSCLPYLVAVSSIRYPRTLHGVVTGTHITPEATKCNEYWLIKFT
jgi:hypothetical protein